ncbi:MAG: BamA/TamA family outer membrane protein [Candidatus Omnitrophota bacterium]
MILRLLRQAVVFSALFLGLMTAGYAEEKKQDLYAPVYTEPLSAEPLKDPLSRLIEFPFKLIKQPVDKGLVFMEEHRLDKKTKWIYERMTEKGIKPLVGGSETSLIPLYGVELSFMPLLKQKEKHPDFFATTTVLQGPTDFFLVGSEIGAEQIGGGGLHTNGFFQYEVREKEPFYGIGPKSTMGDSTSFKMRTTQLGAVAGLSFSPTVDLSSVFSYKNVHITNRKRNGKGDIRTIFSGQSIPGIGGEELLSYELVLNRDTRDSQEQATKGSYQKLSFKFTDGIGSSAARYFTYALDAAKYFQLASPRRIFVTRFFTEYNQTVNHGDVPFFEMVKLGSSGTFPSRSQTSRAYVYNRFYDKSAVLLNLEYRYTVMEYKEFKLNTAIFFDEGQVFKDFTKLCMKYFQESYGVGFYLSYAKTTLLAFSVAHGNEGTQFYLDNKIAF